MTTGPLTKPYDTGVYIGRFQPFHNGHLHAMLEALKSCHHLMVCVGDSGELSSKNPLSPNWVAKRISKTLLKISAEDRPGLGQFTFNIAIIPDVPGDNEAWANNLMQEVHTADSPGALVGFTTALVGFKKDDSSFYLDFLKDRFDGYIECEPFLVRNWMSPANLESFALDPSATAKSVVLSSTLLRNLVFSDSAAGPDQGIRRFLAAMWAHTPLHKEKHRRHVGEAIIWSNHASADATPPASVQEELTPLKGINLPPHRGRLVAAFAALKKQRAAGMLIQHPMLDAEGQRRFLTISRDKELRQIGIPGGKAEIGEDWMACAIRETIEEVALDLLDGEGSPLEILQVGATDGLDSYLQLLHISEDFSNPNKPTRMATFLWSDDLAEKAGLVETLRMDKVPDGSYWPSPEPGKYLSWATEEELCSNPPSPNASDIKGRYSPFWTYNSNMLASLDDFLELHKP